MSQSTASPQTARPLFKPGLGERFALGPKHLLVTAWFAVFFMYYNYIPIFHSDIWGHVAYGSWIVEHGRLPAEDPFVKLAEGVRITDTAWLGQVVFAAAEKQLGAQAISNIFAITMLLISLVLARVFYLQTGRSGLAVAGAALAWLMNWSRHAVVRPEIFGSLCFVVLLWLLVRADTDRSRGVVSGRSVGASRRWVFWIGVPLVFLTWANLHGSFVVGFAALGCYVLGRAIEVLWKTGSVRGVLRDRRFRRWLVVSELAVAATLLNPYGIDLIIHTFLFPNNPNLDDILEWFRLEMVSMEGIQMGFSWLLLVVVLRHSRARMSPSDVLLLGVFSLAVCLRVRMTAWYAPVFVAVLIPHLADVLGQLSAWRPMDRLRSHWTWAAGRSHHFTLLAGLLAWLAFALSPASQLILGSEPRPAERVYSRYTPLGVAEYLRENPPQGQIANPQWWGDWLVWHGPPGLQVFMTTNAVHAAPRRVWNDYLAIAGGRDGLQQRLDRYRVNTLVVHKELQKRLTRSVRRLPGWETVYEDELGLVATRGQRPEPTESGTGAPSVVAAGRPNTESDVSHR